MELTQKQISRFWSYVKKKDGCWLWQASLQKTGYGQWGYCVNTVRKMFYAHRVSYELTYGPIPEGKYICHKCDNRRCCNPEHLYAGSGSDNMRDMRQRKRGAGRGGAVTNAKLLPSEVMRLRKLYATTAITMKELAVMFGFTDRNNVSKIINRTSYAWVD